MMKQFQPQIDLLGLDGDPAVLQIAQAKAKAAAVNIRWEKGLAYELPYPAACFDRVVSCLVFHHLTAANKLRALREVFRVLKPGGEFHLLDFGRPTSLWMRLISIPIAHMEEASDNVNGLLPVILLEAGFRNTVETRHFKSPLGELIHYQAAHPKLS